MNPQQITPPATQPPQPAATTPQPTAVPQSTAAPAPLSGAIDGVQATPVVAPAPQPTPTPSPAAAPPSPASQPAASPQPSPAAQRSAPVSTKPTVSPAPAASQPITPPAPAAAPISQATAQPPKNSASPLNAAPVTPQAGSSSNTMADVTPPMGASTPATGIGSAAPSTSPIGSSPATPQTGPLPGADQLAGALGQPGATDMHDASQATAMKYRSMPAVIALTLLTLGIYPVIWYILTAKELNNSGSKVPSIFLTLIPFVGFWWVWKYAKAANVVTHNVMSVPILYILLLCVAVAGIPLLQNEYNKIAQKS